VETQIWKVKSMFVVKILNHWPWVYFGLRRNRSQPASLLMVLSVYGEGVGEPTAVWSAIDWFFPLTWAQSSFFLSSSLLPLLSICHLSIYLSSIYQSSKYLSNRSPIYPSRCGEAVPLTTAGLGELQLVLEIPSPPFWVWQGAREILALSSSSWLSSLRSLRGGNLSSAPPRAGNRSRRIPMASQARSPVPVPPRESSVLWRLSSPRLERVPCAPGQPQSRSTSVSRLPLFA
jgi:hypothetical protein